MSQSPQLFVDGVCPFTNMSFEGRKRKKKKPFLQRLLSLKLGTAECGGAVSLRAETNWEILLFRRLQLSSHDTSCAEDRHPRHHYCLCPGAVPACPASGIHCEA